MQTKWGYRCSALAALLVVLAVVSSTAAQAIAPAPLPDTADPIQLGLYALAVLVYQTATALGAYFKSRNDIALMEFRLREFITGQIKPLAAIVAVAVPNTTCVTKHESVNERQAEHETRIAVVESKLEE